MITQYIHSKNMGRNVVTLALYYSNQISKRCKTSFPLSLSSVEYRAIDVLSMINVCTKIFPPPNFDCFSHLKLRGAAQAVGEVDLENKFAAASESLRRGIMFANSLYL